MTGLVLSLITRMAFHLILCASTSFPSPPNQPSHHHSFSLTLSLMPPAFFLCLLLALCSVAVGC